MPTSAEIIEARKTLGLTQAGLAARLGVTEGAVRRWEDGSRDGYGSRQPRHETLEKLNDVIKEADAIREDGRPRKELAAAK